MTIDKNFTDSISVYKFGKNAIKQKIFQKMTAKAFPIFLRGGDTITTDPSIFGYHEKPLVSFITHLTEEGLNDFLIDIGANIGLISCQCGNLFSEVHMFEPNPIILKVLEANSMLSIVVVSTSPSMFSSPGTVALGHAPCLIHKCITPVLSRRSKSSILQPAQAIVLTSSRSPLFIVSSSTAIDR